MPTPKQDAQTRAKMRAHAAESQRRWTSPEYERMFEKDYHKGAQFANAPTRNDPKSIPATSVERGDLFTMGATPYYGDDVGHLVEAFDSAAQRADFQRGRAAEADAGEYARAHAGLEPSYNPPVRRYAERYPASELLDHEMNAIPPAQRQSGWGTPAPVEEETPLQRMAAKFAEILQRRK